MKTNILIKLDGQFETFSNIKLVADDVQAYQIVFETNTDLTDAMFNITAIRADGVPISDVGKTIGKIAYCTLKNNIYSVPGKAYIRLTIVQNGSVLTAKELICDCIKGNGTFTIDGDDRVPALTSLLIQTNTAANYANEKGSFANEQGNYAKEQGDFAKYKGEYIDEYIAEYLNNVDNTHDIDKPISTAAQQALNKKGSRNSTITIASSTAIHPEQYDYQCTGVADNVIINSAIQSLNGIGGTIELSEGTFNINALILLNISNVWLKGKGKSTKIICSSYDEAIKVSTGKIAEISDLSVKGDIGILNEGTAMIRNCEYSNNTFRGIANYGVATITNCECSNNTNNGIRNQGTKTIITNNRCVGNTSGNIVDVGTGSIIANNIIT